MFYVRMLDIHLPAHPALSVLGCPIVKKRKLEEAEAEENQSAPKRRNQPAKQAADDGFTADSDAAEEEEEQKEEEEEEDEELKEKRKNKTKNRPESSESNQAGKVTITVQCGDFTLFHLNDCYVF